MLIPLHINVNDSIVLGMAHLPVRAMKGVPVLILCYGLNGNRIENNRMLVNLGNRLENNGVAFIRFDYRGLGISEGEFSDITAETKLEDIQAVISYIRHIYQGEDLHLYLVGFSDGIKQILTYLNQSHQEVAGVVMMNPVLWTQTEEGLASETPFTPKQFVRNPFNGLISANMLGHFFSPAYLRDLKEPPPMAFHFNRMFALFSSEDQISLYTRKKLRSLIPDMPVCEISSRNHVFSEEKAQKEVAEAILQQIRQWNEE